jgi:hypothetical protein
MKTAAACALILYLALSGASASAAAGDNATALRGLNAETVFMEKKGTRVTVDVFTTETEQQRLVSLNDRFMKQFYGWYTHIFINYFNDRAVAAGYDKKVRDPSLGKREKERLVAHIIARLQFNAKTGVRIFQVRQKGDLVTVKKY